MDRIKRERDQYKNQRDAFNSNVKTDLDQKIQEHQETIEQLNKDIDQLKVKKVAAERENKDLKLRLKDIDSKESHSNENLAKEVSELKKTLEKKEKANSRLTDDKKLQEKQF